MSQLGQKLPKRDVPTMSAIHPIATTETTYEPCGAQAKPWWTKPDRARQPHVIFTMTITMHF
jgi:hypothetical protein